MLDLSLAIFIFGLTVPFSLSSPIANTACPKGAVQSTVNSSICYLYVNQTLLEDDAENFCAQSYTGGHVASITNAYENAFIFNYIKNLTTDDVWLGAFSVSYYEDLNFEWLMTMIYPFLYHLKMENGQAGRRKIF
uniref:C-type lectin domain-containing protein n=1 Tax=Acrobeloides nanus TaxID=290746 RepID=A0A914DPK6_9BILA